MGNVIMVASKTRLERSTLIVPGSNPAMIAKAAATQADAICIDCEDAVAPDAKHQARRNVVEALNTLDFGGKLRLVRINGLDTPFAYRDIIEIVEGAGAQLDLIVVPKVSGRDEIRFVALLLDQIETTKNLTRPIGIEALIETAEGILNIRDVATASLRLEALIFGSGDFAASMRMPQETIGGFDADDALYPGHRWHHAMSTIVTAAHAHGLRAIDGPFAAIRDTEELERACRIGRAMGFDGKWCIHPSQPATADMVYSPPAEDIEWAIEVTAAYDKALADGQGATRVNGKMIDAANLRTCRQIIEQARLAGLIAVL